MPPIRRAVHADVPRLMEIRHAVRENRLSDPASVTPADVAAFIDRAVIWVWEEAGVVQGFSAADLADGSVWALFIDPASEGRGLGRALLARACDSLREAGHRVATLSTGAGTRAEGFYRAGGWAVAGPKPNGEVMFTRPLAGGAVDAGQAPLHGGRTTILKEPP